MIGLLGRIFLLIVYCEVFSMSLKAGKLVDREDPEKVTNTKEIKAEGNTQKPFTWFDNDANAGLKPPYLEYVTSEKSLEQLRVHMYKTFALTHAPLIGLVNAYLRLVLIKQVGKLKEDWSSYDREIGKANQEITVFDLVTIAKKKETVTDDVLEDAQLKLNESDDIWICMALMFSYRYHNANKNQYATLKTLIKNHVEGRSTFKGTWDNIIPHMKNYVSNVTYNMHAGMIDMFFRKFPNHDFSCVRVGTVTARYKDCAGMTSFLYAAILTGVESLAELAGWFSVKNIRKEVSNLFEDKDEYDLPDSYFPYQISLGIVDKSAYSAKTNPRIYTFCHIVGCIADKKRSINARDILDADVPGVRACARLAGYVLTTIDDGELLYDTTDEQVAATKAMMAARKNKANAESAKAAKRASKDTADDSGDEEDNMDLTGAAAGGAIIGKKGLIPPPTGKDPGQWMLYVSQFPDKISPGMRVCFERVRENITTAREGTIGDYVRRNLICDAALEQDE
ncbi:MAG: N protein [Apis rhabdovirus 3]|uniref:Nucleoprotein n=1 Tax=Apis rhabdovirus 3 TaxID=2873557 RepID=A0A8K1J652_9RHAB|nr:MAG: N protein [Apis rhabdovirus 3]UCR92526.1 MAG: N protein [Apis rhabdovirus 3]